MRVIEVLHIIPTLSSGGAERQLVEVVTGTAKERFSHRVCTLNDKEFFAPILRANGNEVTNLGLSGSRPWFAAAGKINLLVKEKRPDLIHSWLYDANITARLVKLRNRGIPLITSLQAPDYEPDAIRSGNWPARKVAVLKLIDRATAVLTRPYFAACSQYVADSFQRELGVRPDKMEVIHNSVVPGSLECAPEEPGRIRDGLGISQDAFIFLNIGRLDPQKAHNDLLNAFAGVLREAPDAYLLLIGTGGIEKQLKEQAAALGSASDASEGAGERIKFLGRRKDIGACLEMADAFVFPSLFEGLPLALLEAMSKGLPCVASNIGPHLEVIEDGKSGLMIDRGDVAQLTKAMLALYRDKELRQRLGEGAKKRTEEKFYGRVLMPKWEEFYLRVLSESGFNY